MNSARMAGVKLGVGGGGRRAWVGSSGARDRSAVMRASAARRSWGVGSGSMSGMGQRWEVGREKWMDGWTRRTWEGVMDCCYGWHFGCGFWRCAGMAAENYDLKLVERMRSRGCAVCCVVCVFRDGRLRSSQYHDIEVDVDSHGRQLPADIHRSTAVRRYSLSWHPYPECTGQESPITGAGQPQALPAVWSQPARRPKLEIPHAGGCHASRKKRTRRIAHVVAVRTQGLGEDPWTAS